MIGLELITLGVIVAVLVSAEVERAGYPRAALVVGLTGVTIAVAGLAVILTLAVR